MAFIEKQMGCAINNTGCFGPTGEFYTVFGSEMRFLTMHIIAAVLLSFVISSFLFLLQKRGTIKLPGYLLVMIPIVVTVLLFFLFALLFPVVVMY